MPKKSDTVDDEPIDGEPVDTEPEDTELAEAVANPDDGEWRYDRDADDPKDEGAEEWVPEVEAVE